MGEKKGGSVWLWVLIGIVALAAIGYGWYKLSQPEGGEERAAVEISVTEESPSVEATKAGLPKSTEGKQEGVSGTGENLSKTANMTAEGKPEAAAGEEEAFLKPKATGKLVEYQFKPEEKKMPPQGESGQEGFEKGPAKGSEKGAEGAADTPEVRYCRMINQYVQDYFEYLDTKPYIQKLIPGQTSYARFRQVMERLTAKPPVPAGEGVDPAIMVKNIYFFCRALDKKDLKLIKEVVVHDRDTLEDNMGMFYQWLMLGEGCPNPERVRPSFEVLYRYAGFFLNTTGGRAYMFRRGLKVRLLVSYYSVQIIYQADKAGKNNYGIDVLPYIGMLMEEMRNYPDLIYKEAYLETLTKIKGFYSGRR